MTCKPFEKRFYPQNEIAAQVVGFWGSGHGLAGIEGRFDTILKHGGLKDETVPEIDFSGADISGRSRMDLVLSLDLVLQKQIERQLRQYLHRQQSGQGLALLLQPKTGAILALAGLPTFNSNYFWQASDAHHNSLMRVRLDSGLIRPLLVRAAAVRRDGELAGALLPETVAAPDYGLHDQDIERYSALIGLREPVQGQLPNFDDPGPEQGTQNSGLNEAGGVTLIQLASTVAALVNGGWKTAPYLLNSVYEHGSKRLFQRSRRYISAGRHRIMSPAMGIRMRRELIGSNKASGDDFQMYRGSAVRVFTADGSSHYVMQNLIIAMIPRKMPEMLLLIVTSRDTLLPLPKSAEAGTDKLAAAAAELLPSLYHEGRMKKVVDIPDHPDRLNYERFLVGSRVSFHKQETVSGGMKMTMPKVTGCSLRKGLQRLNHHKILVRVKGSGIIAAQSPGPGSALDGVDECVLTLESKI